LCGGGKMTFWENMRLNQLYLYKGMILDSNRKYYDNAQTHKDFQKYYFDSNWFAKILFNIKDTYALIETNFPNSAITKEAKNDLEKKLSEYSVILIKKKRVK